MREEVLVVSDKPLLTRAIGSATDEDTGHSVETTLEDAGYSVETACDWLGALERISRWIPSLVILAETVARRDRWAILNYMRAVTGDPILALLEDGSEQAEIAALRAGADRCLVCPVSPRVLVATVEALLRRRQACGAEPRQFVAAFGDLVVDTARFEARMAGKQLDLSSAEFRLLAALARRPGHVVTNQQLMAEIWGSEWHESAARPSYLKRYVWHLRRKLEKDVQRPRYIISKRGIGYYLGDGTHLFSGEGIPGAYLRPTKPRPSAPRPGDAGRRRRG